MITTSWGDVQLISVRVPLARGTCTHSRLVVWNFMYFVNVVHSDDGSECDGEIIAP